MFRLLNRYWFVPAVLAMASCQTTPAPAPEDPLVLKGEQLFFNETFSGNGRTCGTCHRAEDNFGLTPAFIATLPDGRILAVSEASGDFEVTITRHLPDGALDTSFGSGGVVLATVHTVRIVLSHDGFAMGEIIVMTVMPVVVAAFLVWYANLAERKSWLR